MGGGGVEGEHGHTYIVRYIKVMCLGWDGYLGTLPSLGSDMCLILLYY